MEVKIKTGDTVKVIVGNHEGNQGKVLRIDREKNRVIVEGVNEMSKHTKPSAKNPQGGTVKKEDYVHISNLSLIGPKTKEITCVGCEVRDGRKMRVSKKSNVVI